MHSSQINNKSFLSSFTRDLETFENAYSVLLDKAKERYVEYDKGGHDPNSHWDIQRKYLGSEFDLSRNLLVIYRYFIGVNSMRLLFDCPQQVDMFPHYCRHPLQLFRNPSRYFLLHLSNLDASNDDLFHH
jgi:chromosome condensin MukBEF MukE localization factor